MSKHSTEPPNSGHGQGAQPDAGRRRFLLAATGAGALAASGATASAPPEAEAPVAPPQAKRGYHETAHIRTYYRTAAYW